MPISLLRRRLAALALALYIAGPAVPARAQDTARVRADSAHADTTRRADTTRVRLDTARVQVRVSVPPPVPSPWRVQLDLGFQDIGGNRALTVFNSVATIERRDRDNFILTAKLEVRYGTSGGLEAVNYQALGLRFDWHPRNAVSPFVGADITRDRTRLIGMRAQGGTGFNFNTDVGDDRRTYLSLGLVFDHKEYLAGITPGTEDHVRWLFRAATMRPLGPAARVEATAKFEPRTTDASDYLAALVSSLRVSLTRRLGFTTRFEYRRDSRPAPGVLPEDRTVSVALSFAW